MKHLLILVGFMAFLTSCGIQSGTGGGNNTSALLAKYRAYDLPATKPSNSSAVRVKVSLANQMVYVMEGSKPLLVMPVSVGRPGKETPRGNFTIYSKQAKRRANTHGYAYKGSLSAPVDMHWTYLKDKKAGYKLHGTPMPYWCEFKSGYGFHTGWLKPYPCSSGCIRMHENLAPKFFALVKPGTRVNIATSQSEDYTIGQGITRPPNADPLPQYPASIRITDRIFTYHKPPTYGATL